MLTELTQLFRRDLAKTKEELLAYADESDIWKQPEGINNSAGNLALHLAGNLLHFVGHVLGNTDYVRDREAEFNDKNVPIDDILRQLDEAASIIQQVLPNLEASKLDDDFPHRIGPNKLTYPTRDFILHLYGHLTYHLGQINYHRRLT